MAAPNQRIASVWLRWRSCSTLGALCFEDVLFPFAEDARDFVLDLEPELRVFLAADDFAPLFALEALPFAVLCFLPAKINLRIYRSPDQSGMPVKRFVPVTASITETMSVITPSTSV